MKPNSGGSETIEKAGFVDIRETMRAFTLAPPPGRPMGEVDPAQVEAYAEVLLAEAYLTKLVATDEIVTNAFVPAADRFDVEAVRRRA